MFKRETILIQVGNKTLKFETGQIARQANGSVMVHCEDTVVFASACAAPTADPAIDFFPLRVDYQEKYSSVGKTASGFIKREGRPQEREILVCRLIDRPLRPMFEEGYFNEVQLLSYVFSFDGIHQPDVLAICACSAALAISDIPLIKPIGAVRVGMIDQELIINPTLEEMKQSKLDLILAGTEDAILMIEGYCDFLSEEKVLDAIEMGHKAIHEICHQLTAWAQKIGKPKNRGILRKISKEVETAVHSAASSLLESALQISSKQEREKTLAEIKETVINILGSTATEATKADVLAAYKNLQSALMRKRILIEKKRMDGRGLQDIRPIYIEQGLLPRTHGSSLFTRGETQSIAVCTLGSENTAQRFEDLSGEGTQRFYLQYFFPPFSVGEVGRAGPPGRREVGHGKLAERALAAVLPTQEQFPYVIRLESNITESNGSSSMASVCGGCLAMMDAGVPIERPVAGIAMGLILEGQEFAILSDILGAEDALGDMDFKITGDQHGITAFQMDIKVEGINKNIMKEALFQAKAGREHILQKMLAVCPESNAKMSVYAPRIETIQIKPSKIGIVIGPGGKQIRSIIDETGVEINIDDNGLISIASNSSEAMEKAKAIIHSLTAEAEMGRTYCGKITSIVQFGFFVEIFPGKEGLCHISEISDKRIQNIHDTNFKEGDEIDVKVIDINDRGQIRLSHKATLNQPVKA
ncbi:MAG: polyribonucleotide nucleotidyltransferase [Chlamydiae bacterium RIFCSPHIGHO2_12_FULL_44_59]|nr:MAG: polyribonucleotide nucleotidyltransferase [Chlamydiae bacterium RIFCSPHIGHO2_01_FULL_44_39]OGN60693.1 MAG: polyribonucleotide nucleotidyltransferase [Chlamydiae bacterium RIFCSPHIGHO2_12_FULL_44_59]OGN66953.1 MAG: polyribonucleotide nucleotidyltransferase [Chlamydiae bacterium RIFCSPLOWO2_01_FULL_44_52]OGN67504.1 MAG: polyribonucleotide nucleotidyltransferase [Chlamydiae bacterium RIFCSPLOWO2_02_FULL_45_22]OGN71206.1 MAG: polyribonucleotide nucleotidyltransferase [Chlamydiae bacterium R